MDKIAEYGIASHWSYKEHKDGAKSAKDAMEQKLQIFRNIIELNEDANTPEEFITSVKKDILTSDVIYVYTPKGDVIELPAQSTPVDFAYKVHSEVGDRIVGAIVNDNTILAHRDKRLFFLQSCIQNREIIRFFQLCRIRFRGILYFVVLF